MSNASSRKSIFSSDASALRKAEAWIRSNGIPDFETVGDVEARHRDMVTSFYKHGPSQLAMPFAACNDTACRETCNTDACHIKTRHRRLKAIASASRLFSKAKGPKYFVTLIRPEWQADKGCLHVLKPVFIRKQVQSLLRKAGVRLAVGSFEVSYNTQRDGSSYWAGGIHLVCAGVEKADLREVLRVKAWPGCARPLQIVDAGNITRRLGYSLKRFPQERREYEDRSGRRNRNSLPLSSDLQFDHDFWLAGILAGSRTILVGARQDANGSIRLIGSRAKRRTRRETG